MFTRSAVLRVLRGDQPGTEKSGSTNDMVSPHGSFTLACLYSNFNIFKKYNTKGGFALKGIVVPAKFLTYS